MDTNNNIELVKEFISSYKSFKEEIGKIIIGQNSVVDQVLMSIFCDGHSLLVGVPGLAKTLLIQTISDCLGLKFNRIQFTPDLMPSDIVGSEILDNNRAFKFLKGPIFSNIILARFSFSLEVILSTIDFSLSCVISFLSALTKSLILPFRILV